MDTCKTESNKGMVNWRLKTKRDIMGILRTMSHTLRALWYFPMTIITSDSSIWAKCMARASKYHPISPLKDSSTLIIKNMADSLLRSSNIKVPFNNKAHFLAVMENWSLKTVKNTLETFQRDALMAKVCTLTKIIH